jgi:HK97 family phage portal protein
MNLLTTLKKMFEPVDDVKMVDMSIEQALINTSMPNAAQWKSDSYGEYCAHGYRENPYLYRSIKYIASSVGAVPWILKSSNDQIAEASLNTHPLIDLIQRPNKFQGRMRFIEEIITNILLSGDDFIYINLSSGNKPLELINMPIISDIKPKLDNYGDLISWEFGRNNSIPAEQIIWLSNYDPQRKLTGMPGMQAGWKSAQLGNAAIEYNKSLLDNGGQLSGVFASKTPMNQQTKDRLLSKIKDEHSGAGNVGKMTLLDGMTYQQTGITPAEMSWSDLRTMTARDIGVALGVPPQLLGIPEASTWSNYQEAREAFVESTMCGWLDYLQGEFNTRLTPLYGDNIQLEYDKDEIEELREDRASLTNTIVQQYQAGLINQAEARDALGYSPNLDPVEAEETEE